MCGSSTLLVEISQLSMKFLIRHFLRSYYHARRHQTRNYINLFELLPKNVEMLGF